MLHALLVHHSFPLVVVISEVVFVFIFVWPLCLYKPLPSEISSIKESSLILS